MEPSLRRALESLLDAELRRSRSVGGGTISRAWRLELSDGRMVFAKARDDAPPRFFQAEARGLEELRQAQALRIPAVLGTGCDEDGRGFIALEFIEAGAPQGAWEASFARALAKQHRLSRAEFGFEDDNFIGLSAQQNSRSASWPRFFVEQRLRPQFAWADARARLRPEVHQRFEAILAEVPEIIGPEPITPSLLHGDLWSGNWFADREGRPVIVDPAVYYGDRDCDIAMSQLFGGLSERFYESYGKEWPGRPGATRRRRLYNLYHELNHLTMFGEGYRAQVEASIRILTS